MRYFFPIPEHFQITDKSMAPAKKGSQMKPSWDVPYHTTPKNLYTMGIVICSECGRETCVDYSQCPNCKHDLVWFRAKPGGRGKKKKDEQDEHIKSGDEGSGI